MARGGIRITFVGSGDAFGSGGRANTCFLIEWGMRTLTVDFGATSLVEMRRREIDARTIDTIVLSHLHGDHFGGIPFLLLYRQFACARHVPLTIVGPVGTRERLLAASEVFFPGSATIEWKFKLTVIEVPCGEVWRDGDLSFVSHEVIHPSGAPATGIRLQLGRTLLAYSGDTEWTDTLFDISAGADLFVCECYKPAGAPVFHMSLKKIVENRERFGAKRIVLTHMSEEMLAATDAAKKAGLDIAHDGLVIDL